MELGFYKNDNGTLSYAPNFVQGPGIDLVKEDKDTYEYPVQGWWWFSTRQDAITYFGITEEV